MKRLARATRVDLGSLADEPAFARKLATAEVELASIQYTEFRILAALSQGGNPGPESSILKNLGANMSQRISELAVEAIGCYAMPHQPDARTVGSNEVQKNIVAKLVLGL